MDKNGLLPFRMFVPTPAPHIIIGTPTATDALEISRLVSACPPLDTNSIYCNLLQCTHFAQTCAIARSSKGPVGFVSGYLLPDQTDVLFIWQVAVAAAARGTGLARRLIQDILARGVCASVRYLHTTVTEANLASRAMFTRLAQELETELSESAYFDRKLHFESQHDSEILFQIGPFYSQNPLTEQRGCS